MAGRRLNQEDLAAIHQLAKQWGKIVARRAFGDQGPGLDVDLDAMEEVAVAAAQGLTQGTVEQLLSQQADHLPDQPACPSCGRPCPPHPEPRPLHVRGAQVEHREPVCHCPTCRRDFFPSTPCAEGGQPRLQQRHLDQDRHGRGATEIV
jgi:hypothetical protein